MPQDKPLSIDGMKGDCPASHYMIKAKYCIMGFAKFLEKWIISTMDTKYGRITGQILL